jgi:hypothetical protein
MTEYPAMDAAAGLWTNNNVKFESEQQRRDRGSEAGQ